MALSRIQKLSKRSLCQDRNLKPPEEIEHYKPLLYKVLLFSTEKFKLKYTIVIEKTEFYISYNLLHHGIDKRFVKMDKIEIKWIK